MEKWGGKRKKVGEGAKRVRRLWGEWE